MEPLNSKKYTRNEAIASLWAERTEESCLLKSLYNEMMDNPAMIPLDSGSQILILFSQAKFAQDEEKVYVASVFRRHIFDKDIIPLVTEHSNHQLAEKCLVSLSFFREYMEQKRKRYSAPSPEYYERVGIQTFERVGRVDVATNFKLWTEYSKQVFTL